MVNTVLFRNGTHFSWWHLFDLKCSLRTRSSAWQPIRFDPISQMSDGHCHFSLINIVPAHSALSDGP